MDGRKEGVSESRGGAEETQTRPYLPFVPQHVVFTEVSMNQITLAIQLLHHLQRENAKAGKDVPINDTETTTCGAHHF